MMGKCAGGTSHEQIKTASNNLKFLKRQKAVKNYCKDNTFFKGLAEFWKKSYFCHIKQLDMGSVFVIQGILIYHSGAYN